jgi:hypothetical protein
VSAHLRVLRDNGFTTVRAEGTRRLYAVDAAPPGAGQSWWRPQIDERVAWAAARLR